MLKVGTSSYTNIYIYIRQVASVNRVHHWVLGWKSLVMRNLVLKHVADRGTHTYGLGRTINGLRVLDGFMPV